MDRSDLPFLSLPQLTVVSPFNKKSLSYCSVLHVCIDFASSFPSVSRDFIWDALFAIGIPGYVIAPIKALYSSNIHLMNVCGAVIFAFCAGSGVRQGCPLSSTIFVMCTDCVMRLINSKVGIHGTLLAYTDDVAIIVHNLWGMIFSLFDAFNLIGEACLLKLNAKKCILIPLLQKCFLPPA